MNLTIRQWSRWTGSETKLADLCERLMKAGFDSQIFPLAPSVSFLEARRWISSRQWGDPRKPPAAPPEGEIGFVLPDEAKSTRTQLIVGHEITSPHNWLRSALFLSRGPARNSQPAIAAGVLNAHSSRRRRYSRPIPARPAELAQPAPGTPRRSAHRPATSAALESAAALPARGTSQRGCGAPVSDERVSRST